MNTSIHTLAWRNLWRHKRRTQLLLAVVAYATIAIIFFWGFYDGFVNTLFDGQARTLSAPVLVQTEAHFRDPDPENALPALDTLAGVSDVDGVDGAAPRLEAYGLLRSPYRTQGAALRGVDPTLEGQVSDLPDDVGAGRWIEAPGEIVLGAELASEIDVRVGERIAVDVQAQAGSQGLGLRVVGLIESGLRSVDDRAVLLHIEDARTLTGVDTATGIALDVTPGRYRAVARAVHEAGVLPAGVAAYPINDLLGGIVAGIEQKRVYLMPIMLLFAVFAAVTVMSTVIVSVIERTREFGVIASLGLSQGQLAQMVTYEAVYTTGLGFVAGVLAGYGLNWVLSATNALGPLISSYYSRFLEGFALSEQLLLAMEIGYLAWASTTILIAAFLAIAVPGRRVRELNPSEAMRAV